MTMFPDQRKGIGRKRVIVLVIHVGIELWCQLIENIAHGLVCKIVFANRGNGLAAHAPNEGGDALMEHGVHGGIAQHGLIRVRVHLDEAGGDGFSGGIDNMGCFRIGKISHNSNFPIDYADIDLLRRSTGTVNDGAT